MIESHLRDGRQDVPLSGPADLKWGVSITDACVEWERTVVMLDELDKAVQRRREGLIERGVMLKSAAARFNSEGVEGVLLACRNGHTQEVAA
jgi:3-deoxy-7-phosphoheptulonate synthase